MKKTSTDSSSYLDRIRSWAREQAHGGLKPSNNSPTLPYVNPRVDSFREARHNSRDVNHGGPNGSPTAPVGAKESDQPSQDTKHAPKPAGQASEAAGTGPVLDQQSDEPKPNIATRFYLVAKKILFHSWLNVLLVAVPVGIALANVPGIPKSAVFAVNAVAIIPLAGLLSHATESVARKLGDTIGALLNVTFGNAVELIIFIIALVKNEIRIVQASLLGSILANLLLILGMCFLFGGLRFREQIYNSTVTQMSACLLSLSVISLVLPTAFHASFSNTDLANSESLKISRGTSVILLLVYFVYLLFQLKSHAYMYESTPQYIIDEEAVPGPAAAWLDSSSSDSSSSDDSDSDSDGSSSSGNTVSKRVKRAIRSARRRKSSTASVSTSEGRRTRASSIATNGTSPLAEAKLSSDPSTGPSLFPRMNSFNNSGSEEVIEEEPPKRRGKHHRKHKHKHHRHRKSSTPIDAEKTIDSSEGNIPVIDNQNADNLTADAEPRRVDFAMNVDGNVEPTAAGLKRPGLPVKGMSLRPLAQSLTPTVFAQSSKNTAMPNVPTGPVPRVRYGIRRTNSLPGRLNKYQYRPPGAMLPSQVPPVALSEAAANDETHDDDLSRTSAIVMLLVSTALVAVCAEFMVDAINEVVSSTPLKEIFIGLILLPIVGNAAEHVTAVTVAMKNKMDLAIGVAVGSSIQIALFVTPLVVILGWIIDRDMTLYFTLFETVCLFVSTFIVNFLVLDGRSNYLEGALLCATYVIIAVVAYFYPNEEDASSWAQ